MGAVLVYSVLFLFFFQLITDFIAGIYAIALLGTEPPPEIVAIVLLLSPFLLLFFKRGLPGSAIIVLGELVLLCRAIEIVLPTRYQLFVAGIGASLFLFLFPMIVWKLGQKRDKETANFMTQGLVLAIAASILLRTLGSTMDLSNEDWFWVIAWLLAIGAAILLPRVFRFKPSAEDTNAAKPGEASWRRSIGLSFGVASVFILIYFAFENPAVISRWTGSNYLLILSVAIMALVGFAWLLASGPPNNLFLNSNLYNGPTAYPRGTALFAHEISHLAQGFGRFFSVQAEMLSSILRYYIEDELGITQRNLHGVLIRVGYGAAIRRQPYDPWLEADIRAFNVKAKLPYPLKPFAGKFPRERLSQWGVSPFTNPHPTTTPTPIGPPIQPQPAPTPPTPIGTPIPPGGA